MNRATLRLAVLALGLGAPLASFADETVPCADAASLGQRLTKSHRLVEAREEFRECSHRACPLVITQDCVKWLAEVEQGLPTVVVTATDAAGKDVVEARVSVDGRDLASKLDGEAVAVDPGPHSFRFSLPDGASLERTVIIKEGVKNQSVFVAFAPVAAPPTVVESTAAPDAHRGPWNTVGWVLGSAGLVGLGVGAVFGITAIVDNNNAHCNASHQQCAPGPLSDARTAAAGADVGLLVGAALLAGGVTLVALTPRRGERTVPVVKAMPALGPGRAGLVLGGTF